MLNYEQTLTFIFRLLNFCVVTAILWYVIKKYVIKSLRNALVAREARIKSLEQQAEQLATKTQEIHQNIAEQDVACAELMKKVMVWRDRIEAQEKLYAHEERVRDQQSAKRAEIQKNAIMQAHIRSTVTKKALMQAEHDLQEQFEQHGATQRYQQDIITALERL